MLCICLSKSKAVESSNEGTNKLLKYAHTHYTRRPYRGGRVQRLSLSAVADEGSGSTAILPFLGLCVCARSVQTQRRGAAAQSVASAPAGWSGAERRRRRAECCLVRVWAKETGFPYFHKTAFKYAAGLQIPEQKNQDIRSIIRTYVRPGNLAPV